MNDDLTLWQQGLAAEHAAIWGFGLVGATPPLALPAAAALDVHRTRRTRCIDAVVALGGSPVPSAPAYDIAKPPSARQGKALAADLEQSCGVAYAALAGAAQRATRLQGAAWLRESSIAIWGWIDTVPALPGLNSDDPAATSTS
ncbi:MAG: DUF4439 domain-containing protein [Actinomycetes bacterium]